MIFTSTPTLQSANPSFATLEPSSPDILNQAVVRMELSFLLKKTTTGAPAIAASLTNGNSISDVAAIIVTIATLDSRHRAMLGTSATAWNNLINALHDSADTKCTGEVWETALATPGFAQTSGIPPEVASGIRVYERYFYLSSVPQSATSSQNP